MYNITIKTKKPYTVTVGTALLSNVGKMAAEHVKPCKAVIVSDSNVAALYGEKVLASFRDAGFTCSMYVFDAGEKSKNMTTLSNILEFFAEEKLSRTDIAIALGGGVTGDITGFASAVYLRGISYIQIPTTLLAAVDSSVGGKTAVDLCAGKNLAGAFHQPVAVFCDCDTFSTLSDGVYGEGIAEALKYGVICDEQLFEQIASKSAPIDKIVAKCVQIKGEIVSEDEFDNGKRQLLNLGHTVGHAIEKHTHFAVSHGNAVAMGMVAVTRYAEQTGFCEEGCADVIEKALTLYGLPTTLSYTKDELMQYIVSDKKRRGSSLTLVLPKKIGDCRLVETEIQI
ncbi:MAG: 3-dehydroquinate synthase [Ruminococcaceae bacterium]|nr:3-dehydroquinate synthase [Oscillospiraceae bacterium]